MSLWRLHGRADPPYYGKGQERAAHRSHRRKGQGSLILGAGESACWAEQPKRGVEWYIYMMLARSMMIQKKKVNGTRRGSS